MVSLETAKGVLNKNGKTYTDEQVKKIMERCFNMIDQQNSAAHTSAYIDSIAGSGYV